MQFDVSAVIANLKQARQVNGSREWTASVVRPFINLPEYLPRASHANFAKHTWPCCHDTNDEFPATQLSAEGFEAEHQASNNLHDDREKIWKAFLNAQRENQRCRQRLREGDVDAASIDVCDSVPGFPITTFQTILEKCIANPSHSSVDGVDAYSLTRSESSGASFREGTQSPERLSDGDPPNNQSDSQLATHITHSTFDQHSQASDDDYHGAGGSPVSSNTPPTSSNSRNRPEAPPSPLTPLTPLTPPTPVWSGQSSQRSPPASSNGGNQLEAPPTPPTPVWSGRSSQRSDAEDWQTRHDWILHPHNPHSLHSRLSPDQAPGHHSAKHVSRTSRHRALPKLGGILTHEPDEPQRPLPTWTARTPRTQPASQEFKRYRTPRQRKRDPK